jgi:UDP-arabinose 4-epimerase
MRILVTGGAGYIGSHTCKALAARGWTPVTYDNLSAGHRSAVRWGPFVKGELCDTAGLMQAMATHRIDAVAHFAALACVGASCAQPGLYYRNNVAGTLSLLDAMQQTQVRRLVFSSTCATYGAPNTDALDEAHPQAPTNPYGASKWMVERVLRDVGTTGALRSIALRYFNAAGADLSGALGEVHTPETHLIPLALQAALDGTELTLHGADYPTPDGTCVRDYVHVADLADAHVLALDRLVNADAPGFEAFNLGNGQGFSVRQVLDSVRAVTGRPLRVAVGPRRPGDPPVLVADSRAARDALKWRPQHAELSTLVASAYRWMLAQRAVPKAGRLHTRARESGLQFS